MNHTGKATCPACADLERTLCGFLMATIDDDEPAGIELMRPYLDSPIEALAAMWRLAELGVGWIELWVEDTGLSARDFLADAAKQLSGDEA